MTFENNFINHSKEYIFLDNETLLNQRQKTFEKISQKNYDKKNNESIKHITVSDLSNFDYFYKPENEDFKVSIIRSPVVYGPGVKGRLLNLIKFLDTPVPLPFKNVDSKFSAVFVGNLIQLINRIVKKNAKGVFLAKDKESRSLFDFLFLVRKFLNREKRFFNMPFFIFPFIKNFNPYFLQNLTNPIEIDNSITNKALDFNPPYSMRYGVHKTIKWYKKGS